MWPNIAQLQVSFCSPQSCTCASAQPGSELNSNKLNSKISSNRSLTNRVMIELRNQQQLTPLHSTFSCPAVINTTVLLCSQAGNADITVSHRLVIWGLLTNIESLVWGFAHRFYLQNIKCCFYLHPCFHVHWLPEQTAWLTVRQFDLPQPWSLSQVVIIPLLGKELRR